MYLAVFKHGFLRSPFAGVGVLMKECRVVFQVAKDAVKKIIYGGFFVVVNCPTWVLDVCAVLMCKKPVLALLASPFLCSGWQHQLLLLCLHHPGLILLGKCNLAAELIIFP